MESSFSIVSQLQQQQKIYTKMFYGQRFETTSTADRQSFSRWLERMGAAAHKSSTAVSDNTYLYQNFLKIESIFYILEALEKRLYAIGDYATASLGHWGAQTTNVTLQNECSTQYESSLYYLSLSVYHKRILKV